MFLLVHFVLNVKGQIVGKQLASRMVVQIFTGKLEIFIGKFPCGGLL